MTAPAKPVPPDIVVWREGTNPMDKERKMTQTVAKQAKAAHTSALKFEPVSDRLVILPDAAEKETPGGIVLVEGAQEKPLQGRVVAAGPGRRAPNGTNLPMQSKVGDQVLFSGYAESITIDDEEYVLVREDDLFGILR